MVDETKWTSEPIIHSGITDCLSSDHPLAFESVRCKQCGELVHASNNECMQTWVECQDGNLCGKCFGELLIKTEGVLGG